MSDYNDHVARSNRRSPRSRRRYYGGWVLLIIAVFAFCLGVLIGAIT